MPDIAMCNGAGCFKKDACYRATAIPYSRQTFFSPTERGDACKYYVPNETVLIRPVKDQMELPPCKTEDHHTFDSTGVCTLCGSNRRPR